MNTSYLTAADWEAFRLAYPRAAGFLDEMNLASELMYLRGVVKPNLWQTSRLAELEEWQRAIYRLRLTAGMEVHPQTEADRRNYALAVSR